MKTNLPQEFISEAKQYSSLMENLNRTQSGTATFASASSGVLYSTDNYPNDSDIFNRGQEGLMNLLFKHVLQNSMPIAEEWNSLQEAAADAQLRSQTAPIPCTCTYDSGTNRYTLVPEYSGNAQGYSIRFTSPNSFVEGALFLIGDTVYTPVLSSSLEAMPGETFVANRILVADVDLTNRTVNFKSGGGVYDTLPPQVTNLTATAGNTEITIAFDDVPAAYRTYLKDYILVYQTGHIPQHPFDGTRIVLAKGGDV